MRLALQMATSRRTFLIQSGAILVLPFCGCGRSARALPAPLAQACLRAKAEQKLGLCIVLPPSPETRCRLGHGLVAVSLARDVASRELFCSTIVVCIEASDAVACFPSAPTGANLIAFDETGSPIESACVDLKSVDRNFIERARALLRGTGDVRVRERAEALRKHASPQVHKALENPDEQENYMFLSKGAEPLLPLLIVERDAPSSERARTALDSIIQTHFATSGTAASERHLPYGIVTQQDDSGCGGPECEEHPKAHAAVACGRASASWHTRAFLRFATR